MEKRSEMRTVVDSQQMTERLQQMGDLGQGYTWRNKECI